MRGRYFWIYIFAFLFIYVGLFVAIYHQHHCEVLYDIENHKVYCHYVKNPVSRDSIPFIISIFLLITIINIPLFVRRKIVYSIFLDFPQRYSLIFLKTLSYRAPPLR